MPNASAAFGLIPRRLVNGSPYMGPGRRYIALASDATPLFVGDPVVRTGAGDAEGRPVVTRATAGGANKITGVVAGFEDPESQRLGYGAASSLRQVIVDDDPDILFEIQEDADGGALAADSVGLNASLIAGTGSTFTRTSAFQLDTSTAATTATLQLRIIQFQQRADNEVGANAKVLVMINQHTEDRAQAGI